MSLQDTCAAFDNICPEGWRLRGVTPNEILEFATFYGCPMFYWAGGQMQATYQPEHKLNRALAFTSFEDHCFFFRNARCIASLTGKRREIVANDTKRSLPPFDEWQRWQGEFKPGHFMAEDLMAVRRQFLESGRNPKVSLRNLAEYSQLSYRCCCKEGWRLGPLRRERAAGRQRGHRPVALETAPTD